MDGSDSEDEIPLTLRMKATAEPPKPVPPSEPVRQAAGPSTTAPAKPKLPQAAAAPKPGGTGSDGGTKLPAQKVANNIVPGFSRPKPSGGAPTAKPTGTAAAAGLPGGAQPASGSAQTAKPSGSTQPSTCLTGERPQVNGISEIVALKMQKEQGSSLANGIAGKKRPLDSDSEDDVPLNARIKLPPKKKPALEKKKVKRKSDPKPKKAIRKQEKKVDDRESQWETLKHEGLLFPPDYKPHGVEMLYDGRPVDLTPEQEEVASAYGTMIQTDYVKKDRFNKNFWDHFKKVLGSKHVIQSLSKCDFTPMYEHFMAEREQKKNLSKEEKLRIKTEKEANEAKYKYAVIDGRKEAVGNFRVEPPGLFRGRGEHPKMGMYKRRIYPKDITINIGEEEDIPEHPYPGQKWAEVRHDHSVTWLAFWHDPVNPRVYKYVFLGADSTFKSESDLAKYEKARKLKGHVADIRAMYTRDWAAKDMRKQQMAVALYFIDKLALRAGHEKDEDEADTVGCCTLKVENVECLEEPANHIKFDFLGKDSIRYENEVEVDERVWALVNKFCRKDGAGRSKEPSDQLFDTMDAGALNVALKDLMPGLTVKVFRTYNASITLDRLLYEDSVAESLEQKKADYDLANKEVAILCNHQRSVPKGHTGQMQKLADKLQAAKEELDELMLELKVAQGKAKPKQLKSPDKKIAPEEILNRRINTKREQLSKLQVQERSKEDLKTVALGTSKINYLDPRITIAWCKRNEVPIEKVFNKSLITKFHWAMDADPEFKF